MSPSTARTPGGRGSLARLGFSDLEAGRRDLAALERYGPPPPDALLAILGRTADPDAATAALVRLLEAAEEAREGGGRVLHGELVDDEGFAMRLLGVLGASEALAEHLVRHPEHALELTDPTLGSTRPPAWALRADLLRSVGADPGDDLPVSTSPDAEAVDALRVEYRRLLLRLAARDLTHDVAGDDAAAELADLAAGTLEAALAVARVRVGEQHALARLAVVAMGKCGGHELNYVSDVDVVFVHEPVEGASPDAATRAATQVASQTMRICSEQTGEGTIWPVDANLRPEGSAGPLTRTLASHEGYYARWAKAWEFQALLKARPVAGDRSLGQDYLDVVTPFVWTAADQDGFVEEARAMRRRVVEHIPARDAERQLKLGSGGLRDVEFAVQLLQLVHGRADETIRAPTTLSALADLTRGGYVGREDGEQLHRAYAFLRTLEHRIQLHQLRRTHVVPDEEVALRRLARSMGYFNDPSASLVKAWQGHRREVRRLHEKLFYRPLLTAVAQVPGTEVRLSSAAARTRMTALGYDDPEAALRHLEALTDGVSRTASIRRTLLPVMLHWFAEGPDPDAGLFRFRRISEALRESPWYLTTLRDEGEVAERLAHVLSTSRYATDLLEREPRGVRMLLEDLAPRSAEDVGDEMAATASRQDGSEKAVRAIRVVRRRELFRIAVGDLLGLTDVADVGRGLSRLTDATLQATLDVVARGVAAQRGLDEQPARLAVVAMGRYGGFELSYGSDADVLFVQEPVPGADPAAAAGFAQAVANDVRRLLAQPGADLPLVVDADLRPEGRQGALVRTIESYAAYYARWSQTWEAQALLRADAVVGDRGLRDRFHALIDPVRYPADGISDDGVLEVRRLKARIDQERLPRGADPRLHLKLGRGGLADIEWSVQLLQMRHAGRVQALRTPQTLAALEAASEAGLVDPDDAAVLADGWRLASRTRNAVTLVRAKGGDELPRDVRERAAVAAVLGYPPASTDAMVNDYLRSARRVRTVVERVFWE
ncbi:bifunctional [glutamine synthetase] adenylyltransferase/[glutamine synthetase]-adenylyl-L-tyrosine phosphorylase [Nocardioides aquaticus]|uniref:bifunctional [glutamine synthetase] adenylyltransferase/[glutamine synthetase]-adenylyl-L-tyrosine phosphorylase n=1 Tax=Nocardioides aquaticus TaxID=160826 RepID=UPI0031E08F02